ncbi:MAG: ribonuclease HI [Deltaproteobacteria bacterium]|nr:ribonuclease HI [Deltaproteobacteria bacterium]
MASWLKVKFKGKDVWAEAGADGKIKADSSGKTTVVYALGGKGYTTFADRVKPLPGATPEEGPAAQANPSTRGRGGKKSGAKANSTIFGGGPSDIEDEHAIHLWTDGACSGNPGPAGSGLVLIDGDARLEIASWLGQGTNNIAELTAILHGLQELSRPVRRTLVVHTDSQYGIGVLAKAWKAKKNVELIAQIKRELRGIPRVVWHWVRGHEGVELNERCDALARQAISNRADWRSET